jgi:hypothetical protein
VTKLFNCRKVDFFLAYFTLKALVQFSHFLFQLIILSHQNGEWVKEAAFLRGCSGLLVLLQQLLAMHQVCKQRLDLGEIRMIFFCLFSHNFKLRCECLVTRLYLI